MNHGITKTSLGRNTNHRKALLRNLCIALFERKRIRTTLSKAKALKPYAEKIVTRARKGSLHDRRIIISKLGTGAMCAYSCANTEDLYVHQHIMNFSQKYKERTGGYTRIVKCGYRKGDSAPMAFIEFV